MIGKIYTRQSFSMSFSYCLEDKLSPGQTQHPRQVLFKDRAEIIQFNQCYGNRQQLIRQFNEVSRLRPCMSLPVFSISLSFPPGERLKLSTLTDIATGCAQHFGFDRHQFVTILHKDTPQQHIHIVANRIGFDRHTASDRHSARRLADYCRQAEREHNLRQTPGPFRYRSQEQRQEPRQNIRLNKLKEYIKLTLSTTNHYSEFEQAMQQHGYSIRRQQRGISFMDADHIIFRGSEAGYALRFIEAALSENLLLRQREERLRQQQELDQQQKLSRQPTRELHL